MTTKINPQHLKLEQMRPLYPIILTCTIMALLQSCKTEHKEHEVQPIEVRTLVLGSQPSKDTENTFSATGRMAADKSVKPSFQVSGTIEQFPVSMGDFVKEGSLIARITATTYKKQYETRKAQAEMAQDTYARVQEVYEKGSIAEVRMVEARSNYKQARADAEASYQNVKHTMITAPFDGYVGKKMMEAGDLASPGQPIVQFFDIDRLKAIIPIPDEDVNQYKTGDRAIVKVDVLDKEYEGEITEISIQADTSNPSYTAKISIPNPEREVKPGMACTVSIPEEQKTAQGGLAAIIIPVETVSVTEEGQNFVYLVNSQNRAERRMVKTGALYNNDISITQGLQKGDRVITSGYHKLTENTPVTVTNEN
jgi:membrane fusion protein (multidrug efflux system)|tara:strand:+ start:2288 stop:3388 length:1101 start_codon:yes stop_codon:yes gene_type:complete